MDKGTRFEARSNKGGWTTVTVKAGPTSSSAVLDAYKVRTGPDTLVEISNRAKAKGATGITWGACSARYWVGTSF